MEGKTNLHPLQHGKQSGEAVYLVGEDARIYSCCLGAGWIGGGRQFSQCRTHIISRPIGLISHIMALLYLFWWSSAFPCRKKCWWPLLIETEGFFLLCWSSSSLLLLGRCISYELVIVVAPIWHCSARGAAGCFYRSRPMSFSPGISLVAGKLIRCVMCCLVSVFVSR